MHDESLYAERILRAGARGYVMKETAADTLVKAARRVLGGGIYLSEEMAGQMLEGLAGHRKQGGQSLLDRLTDRELEVLQLIGQGRTSRHIPDSSTSARARWRPTGPTSKTSCSSRTDRRSCDTPCGGWKAATGSERHPGKSGA